MLTFAAAVVLAASAGFAGSSLTAQAAAYIKGDNTIIRDAANGNMIGGISQGTEVQIVESKTGTDGKTWHHVRYAANGTTEEGWVRSDLITNDGADNGTDANTENTGNTDGNTDTDSENGADQSADVTGISGDGYKANGDNTFEVQGKTLTIASKIPSGKVPSHFKTETVTYNGNDIKACKYDAGDVYLVYLLDEEDNGEFYVLNMQKNVVTSYITVGTEDNPLILLLAPDNATVSASYGKTVFAVSETAGITAYQYNQSENTLKADTILGEYYYVYGITQDGTTGWYLYDNGGKTFVRATTDLSVDLDASDDTEVAPAEDNSLDKMIIVGLGVLCVIFFVLMLVFAGKSRSARKYLPEETFDEDDEEEIMTRAERRREDKKYRHFMDDIPEKEDEKATSDSVEKNVQTEVPEEPLYHGGEVYLDEDENGPAPMTGMDFREEPEPSEVQSKVSGTTKPMSSVSDFRETATKPDASETCQDTDAEQSGSETYRDTDVEQNGPETYQDAGNESEIYKDIDEEPEAQDTEGFEDMQSEAADKEELADLEKMLMAGLQDALKDQGEDPSEDLSAEEENVDDKDASQKKNEKNEEAAKTHPNKKHGKKQHGKKTGKDGWEDELEFLDL